jgi:hypothetical protein
VGGVLLAAVAVSLVVVVLCLAAGPASAFWHWLAGDAGATWRHRRDADRRAERLLRDVLTPDELTWLDGRGYLEVPSRAHPGRTYRVPRDGGVVVMYERGRAVAGLCVQSVEPIPMADAVAMHKLMIEGAEEVYLQRANHLSIAAVSRYGLGALYD